MVCTFIIAESSLDERKSRSKEKVKVDLKNIIFIFLFQRKYIPTDTNTTNGQIASSWPPPLVFAPLFLLVGLHSPKVHPNIFNQIGLTSIFPLSFSNISIDSNRLVERTLMLRCDSKIKKKANSEQEKWLKNWLHLHANDSVYAHSNSAKKKK